jgi:organic radical activating enzyme
VCVDRFVAGGNPADAAFQLKSLIKALHAAGIEVLLEVRTCCTCLAALYHILHFHCRLYCCWFGGKPPAL